MGEFIKESLNRLKSATGGVDKNKMKLKIKIWASYLKQEARKIALWVVLIELIGGYGMLKVIETGLFTPKTIVIYPAQAKETDKETLKTQNLTPEELENEEIEQLKDFIWNKESTRGQHNYSKCEAQGLINGIGYGIPGNGKFICFKSHEEEMKVLEGWIIDHKSQGMSRLEMLKHYTPGYTE